MKILSTLLMALMISVFPAGIKPGAPVLTSRTTTGVRRELRVLTWNIYMLPHCSLIHGNHRRAKMIADTIAGTDYDIVVLQEAFDYGSRRIISRRLKDLYPYRYGPVNDAFFSLRTNSGIWILSRIPLHELAAIEFKSRFGIDALARKGAALFEGIWHGQRFQVAGTHLQADSPDSIRREQCREIATRLLDKYQEKNVPQIVCGDFNIDKNDPGNYHYMLSTLDVKDGDLGGPVKSSYDERDNELARRANGKKRLIDYILVRNGKHIRSIKRRIPVFRKMFHNRATDLSDHYAVEAVIRFSAPVPAVNPVKGGEAPRDVPLISASSGK